MRYEHITLDLSTAACSELESILESDALCNTESPPDMRYTEQVRRELLNLQNELRARLQLTDKDPQVPWSDLI
jgi:hypothetical protein